MDLRTEEHTQRSFGLVVIRFVDPTITFMQVVPQGTSLFSGRRISDMISRWFSELLTYFGLAVGDVASTTTDSSAKVQKAMRLLPAEWVLSVSHALHNSVNHALGGASASGRHDDVPHSAQRETGEKPATKELVKRVRKLVGLFEHTERSSAIYRELVAEGEDEARSLVSDVTTRWRSTYDTLARSYTVYNRLRHIFDTADIGARALKCRSSSNDWNRM
ncbi:hypothetical protein MMPV_010029 [Pyropia vietnamensis]